MSEEINLAKLKHDEALAKLHSDLRSISDGFVSCVDMFLKNRAQCGVPTDKGFVDWITKHVAETKAKHEKLCKAYEKQYPG